MPSAPEFIEAGFLTPSAFAASQAAADQITATATVAGSGTGPILADSSPAGGIGALSAPDQGGAASGGGAHVSGDGASALGGYDSDPGAEGLRRGSKLPSVARLRGGHEQRAA